MQVYSHMLLLAQTASCLRNNDLKLSFVTQQDNDDDKDDKNMKENEEEEEEEDKLLLITIRDVC